MKLLSSFYLQTWIPPSIKTYCLKITQFGGLKLKQAFANSQGEVAKIFGKIGKLLIAEDKAKPQTIRKLPTQWAANETVIPPKAQSVTGSAIAELLDSKPQDKNLLIQARRLYWRYLNNQFRGEYRAYRDTHKDSFPA